MDRSWQRLTSKQTRSANSMLVLAFRTNHTMVLLPSELQGSQSRTYATSNNHSFVVLFVDWSIMKLMLQFGKVQL